MISSVSVYPSFKLTSKLYGADGGYNYYYLLKNITHVIVGTLLMTFFTKFTYTFFEKYSKQILIFIYFLLVSVLIFGSKLNGAS